MEKMRNVVIDRQLREEQKLAFSEQSMGVYELSDEELLLVTGGAPRDGGDWGLHHNWGGGRWEFRRRGGTCCKRRRPGSPWICWRCRSRSSFY